MDLVYEDRWLIAVDKPSGLLSVPGRGADKQDCVWSRLLVRFPETLVVHRLDRDTSGVLLFARDSDSQRRLQREFENRRVRKLYHALVAGAPLANAGRIVLPLRKDLDHRDPPRYCVDWERGSTAITDWEVVKRFHHTTLLALTPETGRSHQLRVHLQQLGHPILGDPIYSPPEIQQQAPRLMLHASELECEHPATRERLVLRADANDVFPAAGRDEP